MCRMKLQTKLYKILITVTFKVSCPNQKLSLNDTMENCLVDANMSIGTMSVG